MDWTNEELRRRFAEIARLLALDGADRFRIRAYERAADAIAAATEDLSRPSEAELADVPGIGASTAAKIVELRDTGTIGMLEDLRARVPAGVRALVRVPGLGPSTARRLHAELGIESVGELAEAIDAGRLQGLKGLGAKTAANLRAAVERMEDAGDGRTPAADALAVANGMLARLRAHPAVERAEIAGSLRRMREDVGDLDLLATSTEPAAVMAAFREDPAVAEVLLGGDTKTTVRTHEGIQTDLRVVDAASWGAALVYFTGSAAHNVRIRERALRRGLTVNEYGVHDREDGERRAGATEEEVYSALGMAWVPPPLREDRGEVDQAAAGSLPDLVTEAAIRGDLHGHSDWSGDGKASLRAMVEAAAVRGWSYWAVTDHADGLPMNGLSAERFAARRRRIAELQDEVGIRILDAAELNIDIDGSVDFPAEDLAHFDLCVASVHTFLQRPAAEQTARIVAAMRNPHVHVIGHLTARKVGGRPPIACDLDVILDVAAETGTALEVNGSPRRLDLSADHVRAAVARGVTLAISTDAHTVGDLGNMRYGVGTAQRGGAEVGDVLNCRPTDELLAFVAAKRGG